MARSGGSHAGIRASSEAKRDRFEQSICRCLGFVRDPTGQWLDMKTTLLDPTTAEDLAFLQGFSSAVGLAAPRSDDEAELLALLPGSVAIAARRRTVDEKPWRKPGSRLTP